MTVRECPRCHVSAEAKLQRLVAVSARDEVAGETERVYCPHYQHSAVMPAAYEIARDMNDAFKDSFSCAYCPFRIVEQTGGFFCLYDQMDPAVNNLYYVAPMPDAATKQPAQRLSVTYWTCSNCHSMIEVSRREKTL